MKSYDLEKDCLREGDNLSTYKLFYKDPILNAKAFEIVEEIQNKKQKEEADKNNKKMRFQETNKS